MRTLAIVQWRSCNGELAKAFVANTLSIHRFVETLINPKMSRVRIGG